MGLIGVAAFPGEFVLHLFKLAGRSFQKEFRERLLHTVVDGGLEFLAHFGADFFLEGGDVWVGVWGFDGGLVVFFQALDVAFVLGIGLAGDLGERVADAGGDEIGFFVGAAFLEQIFEFPGNFVVEDKGKLPAKSGMG